MSADAWKHSWIQRRARELLKLHPPGRMVPFYQVVEDVIMTRREMNRVRRSRYR